MKSLERRELGRCELKVEKTGIICGQRAPKLRSSLWSLTHWMGGGTCVKAWLVEKRVFKMRCGLCTNGLSWKWDSPTQGIHGLAYTGDW